MRRSRCCARWRVKLDRLEDDIFEGKSSEIVRDISEAKQEIINFRRIVRPQRAVLRDLERTKQRYLQEELEIYFDDISDAAERIWDTLENYKEVIEALESTNESVLSHRLNDSFRILTAASVVLLPLTLIASIFGMNVPVPGEGQEFAFLGILVLMAVVLLSARRLFPAARLAVGSNGGRLMDRASLALLEHENMIEALAAAAALAPDSLVERADGVALIATGLPPRLFNQVLVERDGVRPEAITAAVAMTRNRGDPFVVSLRAGMDDRYLPLMAQLGLAPLSAEPWMPGMALHPLPSSGTVAPPPGHEIRRVTDGPGIRDHIVTGAAGFGMPVEWVEAIIGEPLVTLPSASAYVGYSDGLPVSTGLGIRTGRTIGIYFIATVEAARRRGLGAAMTMRIVDDAASSGCEVAILQASPMGYPIYERLGFETVVEYRRIRRPGIAEALTSQGG